MATSAPIRACKARLSAFRCSGILLAGVDERQYLDRLDRDAVDEDIIGVNHGFAHAGHAAGTMRIGMVGQIVGSVPDGGIEAFGRHFVARADIVEDGQEGRFGLVIPDDRQGHLYLSRTACALAMTASCGMRGLVEASARSTLARTHASWASASSVVANSDSIGVSLVMGQSISLEWLSANQREVRLIRFG